MRKLYLIWMLIALFLISLSACQTPEVDHGFLHGTPCAAPCWYGIVPGVTSQETAIKSVQTLEIIEEGSLLQAPAEIAFGRADGVGGSIRFKDGVVAAIVIGTGENLTLAEVLSAYGTPELAVVFNVPTEKNCYKVELFYPSRGVQVGSLACEDVDAYYQLTEHRARVAPDMPTLGVTYWQPADTLEKMLLNSGLAAERARAKANDAVQWTGFGYYPLVSGYW